jgi:hypothetical protein
MAAMAAPIETLCMGCASAACDFKPLRLKRRPLGEGDVLIEMKYCGICHSDGASQRQHHNYCRGAAGVASTRVASY